MQLVLYFPSDSIELISRLKFNNLNYWNFFPKFHYKRINTIKKKSSIYIEIRAN